MPRTPLTLYWVRKEYLDEQDIESDDSYESICNKFYTPVFIEPEPEPEPEPERCEICDTPISDESDEEEIVLPENHPWYSYYIDAKSNCYQSLFNPEVDAENNHESLFDPEVHAKNNHEYLFDPEVHAKNNHEFLFDPEVHAENNHESHFDPEVHAENNHEFVLHPEDYNLCPYKIIDFEDDIGDLLAPRLQQGPEDQEAPEYLVASKDQSHICSTGLGSSNIQSSVLEGGAPYSYSTPLSSNDSIKVKIPLYLINVDHLIKGRSECRKSKHTISDVKNEEKHKNKTVKYKSKKISNVKKEVKNKKKTVTFVNEGCGTKKISDVKNDSKTQTKIKHHKSKKKLKKSDVTSYPSKMKAKHFDKK